MSGTSVVKFAFLDQNLNNTKGLKILKLAFLKYFNIVNTVLKLPVGGFFSRKRKLAGGL